MNEDHQGTRLLLDNHLLRSERRNLDMDGHLGIINSRIDCRRQDVASLEQRLDDLEAANALLSAKVAAMEPRLCRCGREEQPIVVEDGEREESSPSSYQTPPDENQEPIPVRIATMREGELVPVVEQEEIDELFQAIDRERDSQEELSVHSPNRQRRRVRIRRRAQLHTMSTAVDIQPRVPLRRIDGVKGAVRRDQSLRARHYFDCLNHKFGVQKHREEQGVSSGYDTASESGLDPLPDYDEDEAGVDSVVPWSESVLQHCAELTFMLSPDNIRGRLTETPCGPGLVSDFALELTIPLSDEDGTRFLSMLVGN